MTSIYMCVCVCVYKPPRSICSLFRSAVGEGFPLNWTVSENFSVLPSKPLTGCDLLEKAPWLLPWEVLTSSSLLKWPRTLGLRCYTCSGISQVIWRQFASVSSPPEVGHIWTGRTDSCADGQLFLVRVVRHWSASCKAVDALSPV